MSALQIPITERARKYGYIYWPASMDAQIVEFLQSKKAVTIVYEGAEHGKKNVDWPHRRISIGYRWTRSISEEADWFVLSWDNSKRLKVTCR